MAIANGGLGVEFTGLVVLRPLLSKQSTGCCLGGQRFYVVAIAQGNIDSSYVYEGHGLLKSVNNILTGNGYRVSYIAGAIESLKRNIDLLGLPLRSLYRQINVTSPLSASNLLNDSEVIVDQPVVQPPPDTQAPIAVPSRIQPGA